MGILFRTTGIVALMLLHLTNIGLARDLRCPDGAQVRGGLPPDDTKWGCLKADESDNMPVRHGWWTEWYLNGQKQLEGEYREGHRQGHWIWWYPNGIKMQEGEYSSGAPIGRWSFWKDDGAPQGEQSPSGSNTIGFSDLAHNMSKDFK